MLFPRGKVSSSLNAGIKLSSFSFSHSSHLLENIALGNAGLTLKNIAVVLILASLAAERLEKAKLFSQDGICFTHLFAHQA